MYWMRLAGGTAYFVGMIIMGVNLVKTALSGKAVDGEADVLVVTTPQTAADLLQHDLIGPDRSDVLITTARAMGYDLDRDNFIIRTDSLTTVWEMMKAGLGIGFFTPVGFADEIKRGELVHVPLAEPELGDSRIGIIVPASQPLSVPARIALEAVATGLDTFAKKLPAHRHRRA